MTYFVFYLKKLGHKFPYLLFKYVISVIYNCAVCLSY
jgi:hypothetical protein